MDPDPERGFKWIRIRPNAVDTGGSGFRNPAYKCTDSVVIPTKAGRNNFHHTTLRAGLVTDKIEKGMELLQKEQGSNIKKTGMGALYKLQAVH